MSLKGFNKKLPKRCEYCLHGRNSDFSDEVLCLKKGITTRHDHCIHYKYDPLKREPSSNKPSYNFNPEDFSI